MKVRTPDHIFDTQGKEKKLQEKQKKIELRKCKKCQYFDKATGVCSQSFLKSENSRNSTKKSVTKTKVHNQAGKLIQECKHFVDKKQQLKEEKAKIINQEKQKKIGLRKCNKCAFFEKMDQVCYSLHRFPNLKSLDDISYKTLDAKLPYYEALEENFHNAKLRADAHECKFAKKDNVIVKNKYNRDVSAKDLFEETKSCITRALVEGHTLRAEKEEKEAREKLRLTQEKERAEREKRELFEKEVKERTRLSIRLASLTNGCPSTAEDYLDIINAYLLGCGTKISVENAIKYGIKGAKEFISPAKKDLTAYAKIMGRLEQIREEMPVLVRQLYGDLQNEWKLETKAADELKNELAERAKKHDDSACKEFFVLNQFYRRDYNLEAEILIGQYWSKAIAHKELKELEEVYSDLENCLSVKRNAFPENIRKSAEIILKNIEKRRQFESMLKESSSNFENCLNIAIQFMHGKGTHKNLGEGLKWGVKALELASNNMADYSRVLNALKNLRAEENSSLADADLLSKWDDVFKKADEKKQTLVRKARNGDLIACREAQKLNNGYNKDDALEIELLVKRYWLEISDERSLKYGWSYALDDIYRELELKDRSEYCNKYVRNRLSSEIQADWDRALCDAAPRKKRSEERRKQVEAEQTEAKRISDIKKNGRCKNCPWFQHDVSSSYIDKFGNVLDVALVEERDACHRFVPYKTVSPTGRCDEWEPINSPYNHGYTDKI